MKSISRRSAESCSVLAVDYTTSTRKTSLESGGLLRQVVFQICGEESDPQKRVKLLRGKSVLFFIDPAEARSLLRWRAGDSTLAGLRGERTVMVLNTTLLGHCMPLHFHLHEQVGMVYSGKARLKIVDEERLVQKGDFYCIPSQRAP